jgi:hypothetical protein
LSVPLAVSVEVPADSVVTQLRVSGGTGSYMAIIEDCEGDVISESKEDFADVGVSLERAWGKWGMGVQAGYLNDGRRVADESGAYPPTQEDDGYFFFSPQVQFNSRPVGATLGFLYTTETLPSDDDDITEGEGAMVYPTLSLRLGRPSQVYVSAHVLSMFPAYSGGDYVAAGVGVRPAAWWELWAGVGGGGLYHGGGAIVQSDFAVNRNLRFGINGRYGDGDNYGIGFSLGYRWLGAR